LVCMSQPLLDDAGRPVFLGRRLGGGGEGEVYVLRDDATRCAKLYTSDKAGTHARKIAAMVARPPRDPWRVHGRVSIAWPQTTLSSATPGLPFAGFVMPALRGLQQLYRFIIPEERTHFAGWLSWYDLHEMAASVASAMDVIHEAGHCIGDVNPHNFLVDVRKPLSVAAVDTDSCQVWDGREGRFHSCDVFMPQYLAPELCRALARNGDLRGAMRTTATDSFSLAVLIYQALMGGSHPFEGVLGGNEVSLVDRIKGGLSPIAGVQGMRHAPDTVHPAVLDPELLSAFQDCFGPGIGDPRARPSPKRWRELLESSAVKLRTCSRSPNHVYYPTYGGCPWCASAAKFGIDYFFPAGMDWQKTTLSNVEAVEQASQLERIHWFELHVRTRIGTGTLNKAAQSWLRRAGLKLQLSPAEMEASMASVAAAPQLPTVASPQATSPPPPPPPSTRAPAYSSPAARRSAPPTSSSVRGAPSNRKARPRGPWVSLAILGVLIYGGYRWVASPGPPPVVPEVTTTVPPEKPRPAATFAVVGNTEQEGVYLRRTTRLLDRWPPAMADGTALEITGSAVVQEGLSWLPVKAGDRTGWVPQKYVVYQDHAGTPPAQVQVDEATASPSENGCVASEDDPRNCGACGHDCRGGACRGGVCQTLVLAANQAHPASFDVAKGVVYWLNTGSVSQAGALSQVRTDESPLAPRVLVPDLKGAYAMAMTGKDLYWTEDEGVWKSARELPLAHAVARAEEAPRRIFMNGTTLYWTTRAESSIRMLAADDSEPRTLVDNQARPARITGINGSLIWTNRGDRSEPNSGAVMTYDFASETPRVLAANQNEPDAIRATNSALYWTVGSRTTSGAIMTMGIRIETTSLRIIPTSLPRIILQNLKDLGAMDLDASHIYWLEDAADGAVHRARLDGSEHVDLREQIYPRAIRVTDDAIYWVNSGVGSNDGTLLMRAK